jgi:hypothetical protein
MATTELTRSTAHDLVSAVVTPTTSAKDFLINIFCYDEAPHQAPHYRAENAHAHVRVNSLTRYTTTMSRTSTYSLCSDPSATISLPEPRSGIMPESPLVELESQSKLIGPELSCSCCGKKGASFPKCGRCDKAWCSRNCRLKGRSTHDCIQQKLKGSL